MRKKAGKAGGDCLLKCIYGERGQADALEAPPKADRTRKDLESF